MSNWEKLADTEQIEKTKKALGENGIEAVFVENGKEAKEKVMEMIPQGAEVMNMTSETLDAIGLSQEIMESGKYQSAKKELMNMDRENQDSEMRKLGAAPEWAVGSVHAVTEDGKVMIASNTGSQLPAYAYGSAHVIWVVGAQKIVRDMDEGFKRIYEYVLPLEGERAKKAYGVPGSFVSKLLILDREINPNRIKMVIVGEKLGF